MSADAPSALDGLTVVDLSTGRAAALTSFRSSRVGVSHVGGRRRLTGSQSMAHHLGKTR